MQIETFGDYYELLTSLSINQIVLYFLAGYFSVMLLQGVLGTSIDTDGKLKTSPKTLLSLLLLFSFNAFVDFFSQAFHLSDLEAMATSVLVLSALLYLGVKVVHDFIFKQLYRLALVSNFKKTFPGIRGKKLVERMNQEYLDVKAGSFSDSKKDSGNILVTEILASSVLVVSAFNASPDLGVLIFVGIVVHFCYRVPFVVDLFHDPLNRSVRPMLNEEG